MSKSLLAKLVASVQDDSVALSPTLLGVQALAYRLPGDELKTWLKSEMTGYNCAAADMPNYRLFELQSRGRFVGYTHMTSGALIPMSHLPPDLVTVFTTHCFRESVRQLESQEADPDVNFSYAWQVDWIGAFNHFEQKRNSRHRLVDAWRVGARSIVSGILYEVRSRTLAFLLELGDRHKDLWESDEAFSKVSGASVSELLGAAIYNHCTFHGGQSVAKTEINARDIKVDGHFVVADRINRSFNGAKESVASDPVKAALGELGELLNKAAESLSNDQQTAAVEEFEQLVAEAVRSAPRLERLKLYATGITAAVASGATEIATAVSDKVASILSLFGG